MLKHTECFIPSECHIVFCNDVRTQVDIHVNGQMVETYTPDALGGNEATASDAPVVADKAVKGEEEGTGGGPRPLSELAYIRSGDKGDTANIGMLTGVCVCVCASEHTHTEGVEMCMLFVLFRHCCFPWVLLMFTC